MEQYKNVFYNEAAVVHISQERGMLLFFVVLRVTFFICAFGMIFVSHNRMILFYAGVLWNCLWSAKNTMGWLWETVDSCQLFSLCQQHPLWLMSFLFKTSVMFSIIVWLSCSFLVMDPLRIWKYHNPYFQQGQIHIPTASYMVHTLICHCCHGLGGKSKSHLPKWWSLYSPLARPWTQGSCSKERLGLTTARTCSRATQIGTRVEPAFSDVGCFILPRPPLPGLLYCSSKGILALRLLLSNNLFPDGRQET